MKTGFYTAVGCHADLAEDEIEDLKRGTWSVDCPRIELKPRGETSLAYCGPGLLQQDQDGRIVYKVYAARPNDPERLRDDGYGPAGTVIPESAYYDLTAVDIKGREWRSQRILLGSIRSGSSRERVVYGSVDQMSCQGELPTDLTVRGSSLEFTIFERVKIPTNAHTSEHRYIAGWNWSRQSGRDAWRFRAVGMAFLLSNHRKDRLQVHVASDDVDPPPHLEQRVLESLFFVLGRPLYPTITLRRVGHFTSCTLHSRRRMPETAAYPPLGIRHFSHPKTGKSTAEPYRKLFARYLAHVLPYEWKHHPLWGQLNAVHEAGSGTFIDSQALTLAVAIESILGSEFPELGKPSRMEVKHIDEALVYWDTWAGNPDLKKRIKGSISQFKQSRAGDKLRVLSERGAITAEATRSWQKLRNANTHAYRRHALEPEEFRHLLSVSRILFYQLIFCAIGYRGPYQDYNAVGWPLRQYPPPRSEQAKESRDWNQ